jgi:hypothetical protein
VDGAGVLRLRPEVRSAALDLLKHEKRELVRAIDQRAFDWYGRQDLHDPEMAAERIYHALRLGNIAAAEAAWRDGCATYLQYADEDLEDAAASWLRGRLGSTSIAEAPLRAWEHEAADRIRAARQRGLDRAVAEILRERADRSPDSVLAFHEAYEMYERGNVPAALEHLTTPITDTARVSRPHALLQALLLHTTGHWLKADAMLLPWCAPAAWADRQGGHREMMAVCAARVRMTVYADAEQSLLATLQEGADDEVMAAVSPIDVVHGTLRSELVRRFAGGVERTAALTLSTDPVASARLAEQIESHRRFITPREPEELSAIRATLWQNGAVAPQRWPPGLPSSARRVLFGGWLRWNILCQTGLFDGAIELLSEPRLGRLGLGIAGAYSVFVGLHGMSLHLGGSGGGTVQPLDTLLMQALARNISGLSEKKRDAPGLKLLSNIGAALVPARFAFSQLNGPGLLVIDATPDPLKVLVDRFAGKEQTLG